MRGSKNIMYDRGSKPRNLQVKPTTFSKVSVNTLPRQGWAVKEVEHEGFYPTLQLLRYNQVLAEEEIDLIDPSFWLDMIGVQHEEISMHENIMKRNQNRSFAKNLLDNEFENEQEKAKAACSSSKYILCSYGPLAALYENRVHIGEASYMGPREILDILKIPYKEL